MTAVTELVTELASHDYLLRLRVDIDELLNSLAGYRSIILRLGIDPKKDKNFEEVVTKKLDDQLKNGIIQWSDSVRTFVERSYAEYSSLIETIPKMKSEKLEAPYKNIVSVFAPDLDDVRDYVFEIHKCFIKGTLHEILNKMDNFYDQFTKTS